MKAKKAFWEDLKKVKEKYDEIAPAEQKKGLLSGMIILNILENLHLNC